MCSYWHMIGPIFNRFASNLLGYLLIGQKQVSCAVMIGNFHKVHCLLPINFDEPGFINPDDIQTDLFPIIYVKAGFQTRVCTLVMLRVD